MKCIPVGFRVSSIFLKFILKIGFSVFPVTASYLVTESPIFLPVFSETYCDLALPKKILQQYMFQKTVYKSI